MITNHTVSSYAAEQERLIREGHESGLPHTESCCTCHRNMVVDRNRDLWFWEDEYEIYGFHWLGEGAALPAMKTRDGWVCSEECWAEHHEEDEPMRPFLVGGAA